jgi:hypothetical protein
MIEKLACKLGRNDEKPNIELAELLCRNNDTTGIKEIVDGFKGSDKAVASDCIKVLFEVSERNPNLVKDYAADFISGLRSKNNRLVWGSMAALAGIAELAAHTIYEKIQIVISAYESGSVITVDNAISVFAGLCKANGGYAKTVLPIIIEHLRKCRPKEVPQHAERASVCFTKENAGDFIEVLEKRKAIMTAPQQARINKLLKILYQLQQ